MPTYEYQCGKCGFEFEREQRITENAIKTCPKCKSRQAKRLLSAPSFILKGGGWYADGYGSSSGSKASPEAGSSEASGSDSKSSPDQESTKSKTSPSASDSSSSSSSNPSSGSSTDKDSGGSGKTKQSAA